jgi:uncharacterized protein YbaP (TraB family)
MIRTTFAIILSFYICLAIQAQERPAHTLLWKIEGRGMIAPSFLYGTMHTSKDEVFAFMDSVLIDFDKSQAFVMEIDPDSIDKGALQKMILLKGDTTLKSLLTEDEYSSFSKKFRKSTGYPLVLFNKVKPLYLMLMMQEGKTKDKGQPLDLFFSDLAKKRKKKIYGLEEAEDQMALLNGISTSQQVDLLRHGLQNEEETEDLEALLEKSYLEGDLETLLHLTESDTTFGKDFSVRFITRRNVVMARGIERIISKEPAFIAIGAAHLPGEEGVIALLREKGYTVSPVISDKREDPKKVKKL